MRTKGITNSNGDDVAKIEYPGEVAFTFNPQLIRIQAYGDVVSAFVLIGDYIEDLALANNEATADVSIFARAMFDATNYLSPGERVQPMSVSVGVVLDDEAGTTLSTTLSWLTIWGAMSPGEVHGDVKTLRWFPHYPMTIEVFPFSGTTVYTNTDTDTKRIPYETATENAIMQINPADVFADAVYRGGIVIGKYVGVNVWDETFDYTFGNFKTDQAINVIKDDRTCGVFLRWVDKHGFLRYFLFDKGEDTTSASEYGEAMPDTYMSDASLYYGGMMRDQGKTTERKMTIQATALLADEFDYIRTVGISPFVDMYIGNGLWQPVRVSDGDYAREHKGTVRQDVEIEVTYTEETQKR